MYSPPISFSLTHKYLHKRATPSKIKGDFNLTTASASAVVRNYLPPSAYALQLLEAPPTSHSLATPYQ